MNQVIDNLWLTHHQYIADNEVTEFDAVISICEFNTADEVDCEYYHQYLLSDSPNQHGSENDDLEFSYELFEEAVGTILEHIRAGRKTLVHCESGVCRSVNASIAVVMELEDLSYEEAAEIIRDCQDTIVFTPTWFQEFAERYASTNE